MKHFFNFLTSIFCAIVSMIVWIVISITFLIVGTIFMITLPIIFTVFILWMVYMDWSMDRDLEKRLNRVNDILK